MKIEIFGPGCPRCLAVEKNVHRALEDLGLGGKAQVIHSKDMGEMFKRGAFFSPALFIDGSKVSEGQVPSVGDIKKFLEGM